MSFEATFLFRVARRYKGRFGRRVSVRSSTDGASCGLDLKRGERAGLFLRRNRHTGQFESDLCRVVSPAQMRRAARGSLAGARRRCR